jgi:hypothetical protein
MHKRPWYNQDAKNGLVAILRRKVNGSAPLNKKYFLTVPFIVSESIQLFKRKSNSVPNIKKQLKNGLPSCQNNVNGV